MTGPGPCVRLTWRRFLLICPCAGILVALAILTASVGTASAQDAPPQVTGVSTTVDAIGSFTGTWDTVSFACAQTGLSYEVRWDDDPAFDSPQYRDIFLAPYDRYEVTGLTDGTQYFFQVRAVCIDTFGRKIKGGEGPWSQTATATTRAGPEQVSGVSLAARGYDSITANWSAVADADGYVVQWDTDPDFTSATEAIISSGTTATYDIAGLREDTVYHVRVYATRANYPDGTPSDPIGATTLLQPPAQVTNVIATAASDVAIDLSWNLAVRAGGYIVQWREAGQAFDETRQATTTALSHTASDLTPDTRYYFRVISVRAGAADGRPSAAANARTEPAPRPARTTGVTAAAISDSEIQVRWQAAQHATGYVVQWDADSAFPNPDEATVVGTGVIVEHLRAETEYFVRVYGTRAYAANGPVSATDSATTHEPRIRTWTDRVPGGEMAAQLMLIAFAGVFAGVRFKGQKSPRREALITGVMSLAALILPAFGMGNSWWVIGIALLVFLSSIAVIFAASRR